MKYFSSLLVLSILFSSAPVNFAFAQEPENEVNPMFAGILDIFSRKETQSNVNSVAYGESKEAEEPKLSIGDRISSWWDNFSVAGIFSES